MTKRKSKLIRFFLGRALLADAKSERAERQWDRRNAVYDACFRELIRKMNERTTCDTSILGGGRHS